MSEQEKKSGLTTAGGSAVVMVEQSTASRHKQPYRPTELHEESPPDPQHKRTKAPAVPSVAEELKDTIDSPDMKEQRESERAMSSENLKHKMAKKLSSSTKRRGSSPEAITLAPIEVEVKKGTLTPPPQPIPPEVASVSSTADEIAEKVGAHKRSDEDSIIEEVVEVRTPEAARKSAEWSDDEEAGGLPRSESRTSRVSRVVRQLFCCGVRYEAPSEDDVSSPRSYSHAL
ncbi:hypothetical protein K1T71_007917 [Dendrolimus kikuchii]|uniref:Uncharacterized protein n=1 Tax=Dendrolimus kikuchii TaxID=765133 RepID=A0ACC1CYJ7_9NEOP|nr:hypothetical protein K1T71_007917 [Dendrolimus kikuchii]